MTIFCQRFAWHDIVCVRNCIIALPLSLLCVAFGRLAEHYGCSQYQGYRLPVSVIYSALERFLPLIVRGYGDGISKQFAFLFLQCFCSV